MPPLGATGEPPLREQMNSAGRINDGRLTDGRTAESASRLQDLALVARVVAAARRVAHLLPLHELRDLAVAVALELRRTASTRYSMPERA